MSNFEYKGDTGYKSLYDMLEKYHDKNCTDEEHQMFYLRIRLAFGQAENLWATLRDVANILQNPDKDDHKDLQEAAKKDLDIICNDLAELALSLCKLRDDYWGDNRY